MADGQPQGEVKNVEERPTASVLSMRTEDTDASLPNPEKYHASKDRLKAIRNTAMRSKLRTGPAVKDQAVGTTAAEKSLTEAELPLDTTQFATPDGVTSPPTPLTCTPFSEDDSATFEKESSDATPRRMPRGATIRPKTLFLKREIRIPNRGPNQRVQL